MPIAPCPRCTEMAADMHLSNDVCRSCQPTTVWAAVVEDDFPELFTNKAAAEEYAQEAAHGDRFTVMPLGIFPSADGPSIDALKRLKAILA